MILYTLGCSALTGQQVTTTARTAKSRKSNRRKSAHRIS